MRFLSLIKGLRPMRAKPFYAQFLELSFTAPFAAAVGVHLIQFSAPQPTHRAAAVGHSQPEAGEISCEFL